MLSLLFVMVFNFRVINLIRNSPKINDNGQQIMCWNFKLPGGNVLTN
jgi:hypothetical protein